jgi:predicted nucleic acid-binding protein
LKPPFPRREGGLGGLGFRGFGVTKNTFQTTSHALEETRRNITAKYPQALTRLEQDLIPKLTIVEEAPIARVNWAMEMGLPLKDAPILATAVESRADLLVTGEKTHFGSFYGQELEGVTVVDMREAIALLYPEI